MQQINLVNNHQLRIDKIIVIPSITTDDSGAVSISSYVSNDVAVISANAVDSRLLPYRYNGGWALIAISFKGTSADYLSINANTIYSNVTICYIE